MSSFDPKPGDRIRHEMKCEECNHTSNIETLRGEPGTECPTSHCSNIEKGCGYTMYCIHQYDHDSHYCVADQAD